MKLEVVAKLELIAQLAVPNSEPVNPDVDIVEPVTIKLPLTNDVPTTCNVAVGKVTPIPTFGLSIVFVIAVLPRVILLFPLPMASAPITISLFDIKFDPLENAPIYIDPVLSESISTPEP